MNICAIAPNKKTVKLRCPCCGDSVTVVNYPESRGILEGSAWCITCNAVFLKTTGRECWLKHQEHPPLVRESSPVFLREVRHAS